MRTLDPLERDGRSARGLGVRVVADSSCTPVSLRDSAEVAMDGLVLVSSQHRDGDGRRSNEERREKVDLGDRFPSLDEIRRSFRGFSCESEIQAGVEFSGIAKPGKPLHPWLLEPPWRNENQQTA